MGEHIKDNLFTCRVGTAVLCSALFDTQSANNQGYQKRTHGNFGETRTACEALLSRREQYWFRTNERRIWRWNFNRNSVRYNTRAMFALEFWKFRIWFGQYSLSICIGCSMENLYLWWLNAVRTGIWSNVDTRLVLIICFDFSRN